MKIFIMNDSQKLLSEIKQTAPKFGFEISGTNPINDEGIKNLVLSRSDVLIAGELDKEEARKIVNAVDKNTQIIMLALDLNRAQDLMSDFMKDGISNFNFIDFNRYDTKDVLQVIKEQFASTKSSNEYDTSSIPFDSGLEDDFDIETSNNLDETKDDKKEDEDVPITIENNNELNLLDDIVDEEEKKIEIPKYDPINSLKTKVIHFHSKKGGVGKTFLCREIANQFSSIKLPKKLNRNDEYLKTCLIDLDFERGNLRCNLGILQTYPSVYDWMEDIVSLLEKNFSFEKIKYSPIQVISQFTRKIKDGLYAVPTAQGEIPSKLFKRIEHLEALGTHGENVLKSICEKMISSLKGIFDILVIDSGNGISECSLAAYENADANLLVLNPTLADFENTKVLLDELSNFDTINPNSLGLVINKDMPKTGLEDDIEDMFQFLKINAFDFDEGKRVKKTLPLCGCVPFSPDVILFENAHEFMTEGTNVIKQAIIRVCEFILPVFKIKMTAGGTSRAKIVKQMKRKKKEKANKEKELAKKLASKPATVNEETDKIIADAINKIENKDDNVSENLDNVKNEEVINVEETKEEIKEEEEVIITDKETKAEETDLADETTTATKITPKELFDMPFSKTITLDEFIEIANRVEPVRMLKNGVPYIEVKPNNLPKKIWKQYMKRSLKRVKDNKKKEV